MKKLNLLGFLFFCIFFTGCTKNDGDREKIVEMTIYPETGYGASVMSDIWTQPLIFSDSDENQKKLLVDIITEGINFDYERGYEYKFRVKKVWMQNPPLDVSSIKYVYIELLSKKKVITQDSEENIELYVSPKTVKFTPKYPGEYEGTGSSPQIYNALQVKKVGTDSWMALTGVEGFDFEEGYEYVLNVKKMTRAEPYSVKYILLNIKSKTPKN